MKVFFNAPMRGKSIHDSYYKNIYGTIEELGYQVINKYLLEHNIENHYKKLEKGGDKAFEDFYNEQMDLLKSADINIFECSIPSLGIGFQVEKSLEFNKPTVVLYLDKKIPHMLAGIKDEKLLLKETQKKDLKNILSKAFEEAKTRADKRFNFFISPRLLNYLEKVSKDEGITKSKFIRNLILEHMKKPA